MPGILPVVGLAIALSSHAVGATPVTIVLRATFELQCGWAGPHISVIYPKAERLPARIAAEDVVFDGSRPATVTRSGRTFSLTIPPPPGALCDSIGPGTVQIRFTRATDIGNPRFAGRYTVHVEHGASAATAAFTVH